MSVYSQLISDTYQSIRKARKIGPDAYIDESLRSMLNNRAQLLFTLSLLIHQHRKEHMGNVLPETGIDALHHKIMHKHNWPLKDIRAMPFADQLLSLADELRIENLPEEAQKLFSGFHPAGMSFPDFADGEWEPENVEITFSWFQQQ
ncbi:ECs1072 family phage-associated protein [Erwinia psidii]|uniref:ECs1072 family phage-associated protein n=1 Tax=Erwinia psidii TaxID=69224 RepID=UPI00226B63B2|nr:hypothetical protein [Erwinia psidii]